MALARPVREPQKEPEILSCSQEPKKTKLLKVYFVDKLLNATYNINVNDLIVFGTIYKALEERNMSQQEILDEIKRIEGYVANCTPDEARQKIKKGHQDARTQRKEFSSKRQLLKAKISSSFLSLFFVPRSGISFYNHLFALKILTFRWL